jgi:hypothetical protein
MKTDIEHGRISSYNVRGCRCAECKDARRRYSQIFRDRHKALKIRALAESTKSPLQKLKESWAQ